MNTTLHWTDYLILWTSLFVYGIIGIYIKYRKTIRRKLSSTKKQTLQQNIEIKEGLPEIFLGNRSIGLFPIVGSLIASFLSAVSLLGNVQESYRSGIQFSMIIIGYIFGYPIVAYVYVPLFYNLKLNNAHEYLEYRFNRAVRYLASSVYILQMVIYIALALFAPAIALSQVMGIPIWISILSAGLVSTLYTAIGGIRAVVWTDLLQLIVLAGCLFGIFVLIVIQVNGIQNLFNTALEGHRLQSFSFNPNPFQKHSVWILAFGGFTLILTIFGTNQAQVQRYLACKSLRTAKIAVLLNIPITSALLVLQLSVGLAIYAYFAKCDPVLNKQVERYDQILPYAVMVLFENMYFARGLFLTAIFAAALSTVSSGVNSLANVLLDDFVCPIYYSYKSKRMANRIQSILAFLLALFMGLFVIALAFLYSKLDQYVLEFSLSLFGAIGGPILTIFTIGMLFPFINSKGAIVALLFSLVTGLWMIIGKILYRSRLVVQSLPFTTSGCDIKNQSISIISNASSTTSQPEWTFYSLSYLYYSWLCIFAGLLSGIVVSAITGFNSNSKVRPDLLASQARWFYGKFPNFYKSQILDDKNCQYNNQSTSMEATTNSS